jgi:hypothetical protein
VSAVTGVSNPGPELSELPSPSACSAPTAAELLNGPWISPKKRIYFYSGDEWEQFVLEWANLLRDDYVSVKQLGGPDDHGIDIAAMLSHQGLEGAWDCYQCKHYAQSLEPGHARAEILKIFCGVIEGHYVLPRKYRFLAPQGCGATLSKLLSSPSKLKANFLDYLQPGNRLTVGMDDDYLRHMKQLVDGTDFSIFDSENIDEVIALHKKSPYHVHRFGGPLPSRPQPMLPPGVPSLIESRYIQQLMQIYEERYPGTPFTPTTATSHEHVGTHYPRQREAFYSAEALRLFARDSVPSGTFEALQDEVYDGVIEIYERDYSTGFDRLSHVLQAAVETQLTTNALISVTEVRDRKGMCHQLANEDRLTWVRGDPRD